MEAPEETPPTAIDERGRRYELLADRVVITSPRGVTEVPLTDPADPAFLRLPGLDLDDGRPLRRMAFERWAAAVRDAASGRGFESTFRASTPIVTALAITGAALVAVAATLLALSGTRAPRRGVTIEPSTIESAGIVLAVALAVWLVFQSLVAIARAWLLRGGSHVRLDVRGIRTGHGQPTEPFDAISGASFHPLLRCTRIDFADGRRPLWVPSENGPLRRPDLVIAALRGATWS